MSNAILDALGGTVPLLEKLAPTIATAVGGPLAGTAVTFLEKALGLAPGAGAQAVATVLSTATPEQLAAVKAAENDFAVKMKELDISVTKLDEDNRSSARVREMTLKDWTPAILAYVLTVGLFGFIVLLSQVDIPATSAQALNLTLGSIGTAWVAMITYYYGSSRSSQNKDFMLFNSTPATAGAK
ncbi:MAG TPA: hypothetical protein VGM32_00605 [Rhodopila sp.]|jgi:hypothetical protein